MKNSVKRIRWHQPGLAPRLFALKEQSTVLSDLATDAQLETLLRVGIPIPDDVMTAREHATGLLKLAAEVEHALMAQYLYTATSVVNGAGAQEDYQKKLFNIAVQEMGHLATVQNLLLMLAGPDALHLQRDPYRRKLSEKNPIPFVLEPVSRAVLAIDVAAEMPAKIPPALQTKVDHLVQIAKHAAHVELHRVGAIYAMLKWIFLPEEKARQWIDLSGLVPLPANPHLGDQDLRPSSEITKFEARPDEWPAAVENFILETPHNCADAVAAIDKITAQGEGFEDTEHSHFISFIELFDAFESAKLTGKALATSPTLGGGHGGDQGQEISHQYTRRWGAVFSLQYSLLILTIYHALRTPRMEDGTPGLRAGLVDLALRAMKRIIRSISDVCASLPMRDGSADLAGPPYDLDPAVLEVFGADELPARHLHLLDDLVNQYKAIEKDPEFASHPAHSTALANLRSYDKRRRDLFTPQPPNV